MLVVLESGSPLEVDDSMLLTQVALLLQAGGSIIAQSSSLENKSDSVM